MGSADLGMDEPMTSGMHAEEACSHIDAIVAGVNEPLGWFELRQYRLGANKLIEAKLQIRGALGLLDEL